MCTAGSFLRLLTVRAASHICCPVAQARWSALERRAFFTLGRGVVPILLACLSCLEFMLELSAPVHLQDWNVPSWKGWFQLNACDAVGRGHGCKESVRGALSRMNFWLQWRSSFGGIGSLLDCSDRPLGILWARIGCFVLGSFLPFFALVLNKGNKKKVICVLALWMPAESWCHKMETCCGE